MKFRTLLIILIISTSVLLFSACGNGDGSITNNDLTDTVEGTPDGSPEIITTSAPDPSDVASEFLTAWTEFNYGAMYEMLSNDTKAGLSYEEFEERYTHVEREATLTEVGYEILQSLTNPKDAQVAYRVTLYSGLAGEIVRDTMMNLVLEDGGWKLAWDDTVIIPELAGGNKLSMQRYTPIRGDILDRNGEMFAETNNFNAVVFSVIPSSIEEEEQAGFFLRLQNITGTPAGYFYGPLAGPDPDYTVKITELPEEIFNDREGYLNDYTDAYSYSTYLPQRFYYYDQAGAHAIGYVGSIQAGDESEWARQGYPVDSLVGQIGLESWAEPYLSGQRGGDLYVINPDGTQRVTILGKQDLEPSKYVVTTLDVDLQKWAQLALGDFTGAAVVMERDTGKILAIASSPSFDPNDADPNNQHSAWATYFDASSDSPFINRATQGQYPPGSIFKPITMAAALESGVFDVYDMFYCDYTWDKLGVTLYDWTWEKGSEPSGNLNIQGALMRSCNPWFYEIGYQLYQEGFTQMIADTARDFGLGSETGIVGLLEESGNITNPDDMYGGGSGASNSVQQAIGQADTVITPLQAAAYVAAIGNGGTLFVPQIVERIEDHSGNVIEEFEPQINGTLPLSAENLEIIQNAMWKVTKDPSGTASRLFQYFPLSVYGKTGTAQNGSIDSPHAWFIGYTDVQNEDVPDIAIAVLIEFSGEGSEFAAPVFRRIVEAYFYGTPTRYYAWESEIGRVDPYYFNPELACEDDPAGDDCKYYVDLVCYDEPDGEECKDYTKIYEDAVEEQENN
jgi:penicillin-binding protein 2